MSAGSCPGGRNITARERITLRNAYRIACVPGDGVGPELMDVALEVLNCLLSKVPDARLEFSTHHVGYDYWVKTGEFIEEYGRKFGGISEATVREIEDSDAMLYVATSGGNFPKEFTTPFPVLRRRFKVYANVRPSRSYPNVPCLRPDIDLVLVREQTEGMWMGSEVVVEPGVTQATATITRAASTRIAKFAFEMARQRGGKKRVTCVHKANVLRVVFGQFVEACAEVAADYPDVRFDEMHTDVLPFVLINAPQELDVVVTTNMYGDAISGETAAIAGGLGIAPSGEYGDDYAIFRPVHGSAPDIAGKNVVNPIATLLSVVMMLRWLAFKKDEPALADAGRILEEAIASVLAEGSTLTRDLGGNATTTEVAKAVCRRILQA